MPKLARNFKSFYSGKDSPLYQASLAASTEKQEGEGEVATEEVVDSVIERSSSSARLILFSSNEFLVDQTL